MGSSSGSSFTVLLCTLIGLCALNQCCGVGLEANMTAQLFVNASKVSARQIPQSLFGVFFEVLFLHTNKFSYLLHFILLFKRFLKILYFWVPLIRCPLIYIFVNMLLSFHPYKTSVRMHYCKPDSYPPNIYCSY